VACPPPARRAGGLELLRRVRAFIWGDAIGDPEADEILRALRAAGAEGMTRWDIVNHFSRHKKAE